MGRIIVHIGTHKTGTTSIQRTLAQHRTALKEIDFFYPDYDFIGKSGHYAHIGMANALVSDHPKYTRDDAELFFQKVADLSQSHAITLISAEPLYRQIDGGKSPYKIMDPYQYWDARDKYISRFRKLIGPAEIVIALRRQDEFAESMYQEHVKVTRYAKNFETYLKESWFHFAYRQQVHAWERHFKKVHVVPFEEIKGDNITRKFLKKISCDAPFLENTPIQNVSMPHDGVILKRILNGSSIENQQLKEVTNFILSDTFRSGVFPGKRSFFRDEKERVTFVDQHLIDNTLLAQSCGLDIDALFPAKDLEALRYGDAISKEERNRLLSIIRKNHPTLNIESFEIERPTLDNIKSGTQSKDRHKSFIHELAQNRIDYTAGGAKLVVTFENAGQPHRSPPDRRPWGHKFFVEEGHSVLGVIAKSADWYRNSDLHDYLISLRDSGFFLRFDRVFFAGSSMGGFAAAAFSSLAPSAHVISFNPQSTLRNDLAPWDTSHPSGMRQDWSGPFSDGAAEIAEAAKIYVFYDQFHTLDRRHAERFFGGNVHLIRAPFLGHGLPDAYLEMGILKDIMRQVISGKFSEAWYYSAIRKRRNLARYYKGLVAPLAKHGLLSSGEELMRKACDIYNDPYFASRSAVFTAANGRLEEAIKVLDDLRRKGRKAADSRVPATRLVSSLAAERQFITNFSVIVPVFKSWHSLPALLQCLARQTRQDFELILADNELEAFPEEKIRRMMPAPLAGRWRRVHCPQPGSYAARNAAIGIASAPLLVFTDADCAPEPNWLAHFAKAARQNPDKILAGPVRVRAQPAPNLWEIYDTVRGIPQESYVKHGYATTANLAVPKAVMDRLGGFDAARFSGGDAAFCRRAGRMGIGMLLVAGSIVTHPARTSRIECETKARRIKGGQLHSGSVQHRLMWFFRSFMPPLREMLGYLRNANHPRSWRVKACGARLWLWGIELKELTRLLVLRGKPERR